ncbi:MAG: hypothetical protein JSW17_06895, partial [Candidatus Omnitrophota bacterium]
MEKVITYSLGQDLIEKVAALLYDNFAAKSSDLSRVACVFGGKRPALFLKRELSRKIRGSFVPPRIFSIDEFIDYVISGYTKAAKISDLDAAYTIYVLAKKHIPGLLSGRKEFSQFL